MGKEKFQKLTKEKWRERQSKIALGGLKHKNE